jgi:formylglycine-generating enzyme required for sulfatase activity
MARPVHVVTFADGFFLSQNKITQGQWEKIMGTRPWTKDRKAIKNPNAPALDITWNEAKKFCRILSEKEGRTYRLLSESEWEYVARSGSSKPISKQQSTSKAVVNSWGFIGMTGQQAEWCEDLMFVDYDGAPIDGSAYTKNNGVARVIRGGKFGITGRFSTNPNNSYATVGFRIALSKVE